MASMWRRAMVYLGLQDDDELDYGGGDYEPYGDYADPARDSRPAQSGTDDDGDDGRRASASDRPGVRSDSGTVRATRDYGPDPDPARRPARATSRRSPRPARRWCARSAPRRRPGCT